MLGKRLINSNSAAAGGSCTTDNNNYPSANTAYYKMSDATDEVGSFDAVGTNVNFNVAGKYGNSGLFNGSDSKIIAPNSLSEAINTTKSFTISLWFKISGGTDRRFLYFFGHNTYIYLEVEADNTLRAVVNPSSGGASEIDNSTVLTNNIWYNAVLTGSNAANLTLYLNGSSIGTASWNGTFSNANIGTNIGCENNGNLSFEGSIDQMRVFNSVLSASQVSQLYNEVYCVPTIVPTEHFNTVLYNGTGTTNAITGVGFTPDLVWTKGRNNVATTEHHRWTDSVRGTLLALKSDSSDGEESRTGGVQSFDSDGFTLGNDGSYNFNGLLGVSWNWYAPTAETNTSGTITSTIKKNVDAGFSIVKWSGNGSNDTIGHGIDTPELIIYKALNATQSWTVLTTLIDGSTDGLNLDTTGAKFNISATGAAPTSTVFGNVGFPSNMIAYCFHSVDGMSRVGSYVGLGSSGNPVIVTGFRPAFVMIKNTTTGSTSWVMADNKRDYNDLYANSSSAEFSSGSLYGAHFLSNGFTTNTADVSRNASGNTYIFLAIAEEVFNPSGVTRNATNPFGDASEKALYKFEDNGNDAYGNYTANSISNISYSSGYIDKAAAWNGTNSFMRVPISFNTNAAYSISFWAKLGVGSNDHCYFWQIASGGTSQTALQLAPDNYGTNNLFRFYFNHQGVTNSGTSSIPTFTPTGGWQHFVGTFDGSSLGNLYVDGNNVQSNFALSPKANVNTNLLVGGNLIYGGSTQYKPLTGLDQVRMYTKELDSGEVTQLYNE